ncbi:vascular endothelial growth factor A [Anabrus simplex]|uniref:vascular endothelial growth factor A n=1 Tax=Anabrus simplex TaxID=316456 RepID=UPI0035A282F6
MWSPYFFVGTAILALHTAVSQYSPLLSEYRSLMMNKYIPNEKGCRDKDFSKEAKQMMINGMCKEPRPMTVPIFSDDPSMQFIPGHVMVNRCQGLCFSNNRKACVASRSEEVKIPIRRTNRGQKTECGYVVVEEHQSCMCGCAVSEQDCIPGKQKFNPGTCECECMNQEEKDMCTESGKEWNMNECTCDCPVKYMDCPHKKVWVPKFCECRRMAESP